MNITKNTDEVYFWNEFREIFTESSDETVFAENGFPRTIKQKDEVIRKLRITISKFDNRECVLVVNDLQKMPISARTHIVSLLKYIAGDFINHFHVVLITSHKSIIEASDRIDSSICIIETELFRLGESEIPRLFHNYGITLDKNDLMVVQRFSEGWMSALSALVIVALEFERLDSDVMAETTRRMSVYIQNALYDDIQEQEKQLIAIMHGFDRFSIEQAAFICKSAGFVFDVNETVGNLVSKNFFIDYNYTAHQYRFHNLLRAVSEIEFRKLDTVQRKKVLNAYEAWKREQRNLLSLGGFIPEIQNFKNLTKRERDIYFLLQAGQTYKSIGENLYISENTVKTVVKSIYRKLNVHSKKELLEAR
jgi:ATP/maltotriose-dependent transcriptional regulator MalT